VDMRKLEGGSDQIRGKDLVRRIVFGGLGIPAWGRRGLLLISVLVTHKDGVKEIGEGRDGGSVPLGQPMRVRLIIVRGGDCSGSIRPMVEPIQETHGTSSRRSPKFLSRQEFPTQFSPGGIHNEGGARKEDFINEGLAGMGGMWTRRTRNQRAHSLVEQVSAGDRIILGIVVVIVVGVGEGGRVKVWG